MTLYDCNGKPLKKGDTCIIISSINFPDHIGVPVTVSGFSPPGIARRIKTKIGWKITRALGWMVNMTSDSLPPPSGLGWVIDSERLMKIEPDNNMKKREQDKEKPIHEPA